MHCTNKIKNGEDYSSPLIVTMFIINPKNARTTEPKNAAKKLWTSNPGEM